MEKFEAKYEKGKTKDFALENTSLNEAANLAASFGEKALAQVDQAGAPARPGVERGGIG